MEQSLRPSQKRIWELDALRGVCILFVIVIHILFDLVYFLNLPISFPPVYTFIQNNGGIIFIVLSGICVTLGSKSLRRGVIVFGCGLLITLVTYFMSVLHLAGREIVVWFGILHLLGACMILYPLFRSWPIAVKAAVGAALIVAGYCFLQIFVKTPYLFVLGLRTEGFTSGDYFPILPYLGWFLLGTVLGGTLYKDRKSKLPQVNSHNPALRFFQFCGRQSLWIYLLHQPLVYGILTLITA